MRKAEFLKGVQPMDNHRHLLWPSLEITTGSVIELGMGGGSTPFLHHYCEVNSRRLFSFDNDLSWVNKFEKYRTPNHQINWASDWDSVIKDHPSCDVLLIDHTPAERRHIDIEKYKNSARIIVIHDSQPEAKGYFLERIWPSFKYRSDFKTTGVWATAVSNFIEIGVSPEWNPIEDVAHYSQG